MPLIRLECSQDSATPALRESLEKAREQFVSEHRVDFDLDANLCPRLPAKLSFFAFPEQQLLAYEKHREFSELGHVFRIANGLHDLIDALVMTGSGGGILAARALVTACCDPHHNELTRAARGSKPRIYFADDDLDNDQFISLLGRLAAGGYGDGLAEKTWAIIAADPTGRSCPNHVVLDHLVAEIGSENSSVDQEFRCRLVTSIGPVGGELSERLSALGFEQSLRVPDQIADPYSVLTPVGLLLSAFLGFDCIQLLVGAAAINENFRNEPFSKNLVLRFVAANQLNEKLSKRIFAWWSRSLRGFDGWLETLQSDNLPLDVANKCERETLLARLKSGSLRNGELVCNHVDVDAIRTDSLSVNSAEALGSPDDSRSFSDLRTIEAAAAYREIAAAGICQNKITLPVIDTHSLGQWMQMMMLASAIETRLAH